MTPLPCRPKHASALGLAGVLALLVTLGAGCSLFPKKPNLETGPLPVLVAPVLQKDVPIYTEAVGQTRGSVEVEIRARVEGYLESIDFREGGWVNKGDLLYRIDPEPAKAALAKAKGDLAQAVANDAKAKRDVTRLKPLAAEDAISQQELDNAVAAQEAAAAVLDAARAAVRTAEINLSYTTIRAPLSGMVGISQVFVGNLVGRGQATLLTTISAVDPIRVRFSIPEADYLRYARRLEAQGGQIGARQGNLQLVLADGSVYERRGSLRATERTVDAATGSLTLEAEFPNPGRLLVPGQFARVRGRTETRKGGLLVPQRAVSELQGTYYVSLVKSDGTIEQRSVVPGARVGSYWVIDQGLKPGESVVVEGQMRARPGMKVAAKPAPAGTDSLPPLTD